MLRYNCSVVLVHVCIIWLQTVVKKNRNIKYIKIYQNILRMQLEYVLRGKDLVSEDLHNETYQRNTIIDGPVYCCLHI